MKINKKSICKLSKCYSIAPLRYKKKDYLLVAAEKQDRCLLFDLYGNIQDTLWDRPGGVMSMQQVPESDGVFLATHKFYSQNDSAEAKIMKVSPGADGSWERSVLVDLPFVHRFGIMKSKGINYLIACTIKSAHAYRDDWSSPGKVYAAELPKDLNIYNEDKQLKLYPIKDDMLKNHGFYMQEGEEQDTAIISCDNGVYVFAPPTQKGGEWNIEKIFDGAASDAVLVDMDGDGEKELAVISPFHGDDISIYKKSEGKYIKVYSYGKPAEFSHAIYGGKLLGQDVLIIGHRHGSRDLLMFSWNKDEHKYNSYTIDTDCGSANVYKFDYEGKEYLISANRETDEIAIYNFEA